MSRLARTGTTLPEIQRFAKTASRFPWEWDNFLRNRFTYRYETEELVRTVERMLAEYQARGKFEGDCDDVSVLNGSVLSAARYPTRFVAIRLLDREEFSHVFTESLIDGEWQVFDPVVPFGTQYPDVTETMLEEVC